MGGGGEGGGGGEFFRRFSSALFVASYTDILLANVTQFSSCNNNVCVGLSMAMTSAVPMFWQAGQNGILCLTKALSYIKSTDKLGEEWYRTKADGHPSIKTIYKTPACTYIIVIILFNCIFENYRVLHLSLLQ